MASRILGVAASRNNKNAPASVSLGALNVVGIWGDDGRSGNGFGDTALAVDGFQSDIGGRGGSG